MMVVAAVGMSVFQLVVMEVAVGGVHVLLLVVAGGTHAVQMVVVVVAAHGKYVLHLVEERWEAV